MGCVMSRYIPMWHTTGEAWFGDGWRDGVGIWYKPGEMPKLKKEEVVERVEKARKAARRALRCAPIDEERLKDMRARIRHLAGIKTGG